LRSWVLNGERYITFDDVNVNGSTVNGHRCALNLEWHPQS